jgi:hypothetical protein
MNKNKKERRKKVFMSLSMDGQKGVFESQVASKTNGLWLTELEPCDQFYFYAKLFLRFTLFSSHIHHNKKQEQQQQHIH